MIPRLLIVVLIDFVSSIAAAPKVTPSLSYSNNTSTALQGATTPVCCFVVQDTVTEEWFQQTSFSTTHSVVNLTSITTYMTIYSDTTKKSLETNVYTTNHTFEYKVDVGINPITIMTNDAPGPAETTIMIVNDTAVITGGMTLSSPGAFYVYNTVKIITATAITDKYGNLACGTTSSFSKPGGFDDGEGGNGPIPTFSNINKYAQAYFGGLDIDGQTSGPTITAPDASENEFTYSNSKLAVTTAGTDTLASGTKEILYTNSDGVMVTQKERPTGVVISLVTPFVYAPSRGSKGETGEQRQCLQSVDSVNYGWIPQTLINFLASNEQYEAQYPGLGSCLPGGPSILQIKACRSALPTFKIGGGDLTSGTTIFITPEPTQMSWSESWSSTDTYPTTQSPAAQLVPTSESTDTYPTTQSPATRLLPTSESTDTYPTTQQPATELLPSAATNTPTATIPPPPPNIPPAANSPLVKNPPTGNAYPVSPLPENTPQPNSPPAEDTRPANSPPFVTIPSPTTIIPPRPSSQPKVLNIGGTTAIKNTPFLIIPSSITIPIAQATDLGLQGSPTVDDGTTEVVVGPTSVSVPSGGGSGNGATNVFAQVSIAGRRFESRGRGWAVAVVVFWRWTLSS